jgi:LPS sulfotransferase NodH
VAQAISHAILVKLNVSHVHDSQQAAWLNTQKEKLAITKEEINFFLKKLLSEERAWENFFQQNGIDPLRIIYEDFCADVSGYSREVANFLDVEINDSAFKNLLNNVKMRKTRSNYERNLAVEYLTSITAL